MSQELRSDNENCGNISNIQNSHEQSEPQIQNNEPYIIQGIEFYIPVEIVNREENNETQINFEQPEFNELNRSIRSYENQFLDLRNEEDPFSQSEYYFNNYIIGPLNIPQESTAPNSFISEDEEEEKINISNLMKLSLKAPFRPLIKLVEIIGGIKLKKINLNLVFGGVKRNKIILHLKLYQIICFDKEGKNKSILENAKPKNEKLFKYILSRKYKFLMQKYNEINPKFIIDGERKTIQGFKTIDEVLENKYRKKRANIREKKILEIKKMTSDILNDFHGLKGRNPKKNGKLGLDIKAEYIEKFEENQEMFGNFGLNINEEEDEIENSFLNFNFHDNFESLIAFYREFRAQLRL